MRRNAKEEKQKRMNRLYLEKVMLFEDEGSERLSKYRYRRDDRMIWIPVEEPQFIGWEATLVLSESAARRQDADILRRVLHHLKASGPQFFKSEATVKLIRRCGRRYNSVVSAWREFRRIKDYNYWLDDTPPGVVNVDKCTIKCAHYNELTEREKKYFVRCSKTYPATWFRDAHIDEWYQIDWHHFPIGELMVKIDKAYSTHRGIPKATEISRENEIEDILDSNFYYSRKYGKSYGSWGRIERRQRIKASRKAFKVAFKVAVNDVEPDLAADEVLAKRLKYKE